MIGKLRERVSLQRSTKRRDGSGGATETWTEYAEVWAEVRAKTGRERENAMRSEALSDYMVTIRYRSDLLSSDRIVWRDRGMNIRFIMNEGPRKQYLVIEAEMGATS